MGKAKSETGHIPSSFAVAVANFEFLISNFDVSPDIIFPLMSNKGEKHGTLGDVELLRLHIAGDERAFSRLIGRYRKELFGFLARFIGDAHLAEDVFQEAFLQLHISAGVFDQTRRLKPWLFTIAANKARDAMRSRQRRRAVSLDVVVGDDGQATSYSDLMPSDVPPPDESISNLDLRRAVQNIVRAMPENLRVVLLLAYFNRMPYQEVADVLGLPLGTVKSRIHSAVKFFAQKWKTFHGTIGR